MTAEQRALVALAQSGDAEALDTLLRSMQLFIRKQAGSFARTYRVDADDLFQEGSIAVLNAVRAFDLNREEAKFSTYAGRAITNAMTVAVHRENRAPRSGNEIELVNLAEKDTPDTTTPDPATLRNLLASLHPADRQAVELRYGLRGGRKLSLAACGLAMGVSSETVRQRCNRAIRRMRGERNVSRRNATKPAT